MLHNSGAYGPSEPPVNVNARITEPRISEQLLNGNLNNSIKSPQTASESYSIQGYNTFAHQPLTMTSQMAPYTNYPINSYDRNFVHDQSRISQGNHENLIQDCSMPLNHSLKSTPDPLGSEDYALKRVNPLSSKDFEERPSTKNIPLNIPQIDNITESVNLSRSDSNFQRNEVFLRRNVENRRDLRTKNQERTEQEIARRKSLENTVRLIENLLMNSTNNREKDKIKNNRTTGNNSKLTTENNILNDERRTSDEETEEENELEDRRKTETEFVTVNSIKDDSDEDVKPDISKINLMQNNIEVTTIEVKVEPISSRVDVLNIKLFQEDVNGVFRHKIMNSEMIVSEDSIEKAKEIIKNGAPNAMYFECQYCLLYFSNPKRFLIHTKWHSFGLTNEKRRDFIKQRENIRNEKKHAKRMKKLIRDGKNKDGNFYTCQDCNKVFSELTSLKKHRTLVHPDEVRECKICKMAIPLDVSWSKHHETHKNEAGDYQCSECPKKFKFPQSLTKHIDTHAEKTHKCEECPKKFGSSNLLKMHMKSHERMQKGVSHHCTYCGKGFYEHYSLQVHERTHRNEKPFKCDICTASFGTNSSLKRHVKVSHNKMKPFECSECHRHFATELAHASHAKRAHGDPETFPFICKQCPNRYMKSKDLRKHMYKVHPKAKVIKTNSETETE